MLRSVLLRGAALSAALAALAFSLVMGAGSQHRSAAGLAPGAAGPRVTLYTMAGRGELMITGIPQAPSGKIYELWERRAGYPQLLPTDALFTVARGGRAAVGVPGSLRGLRELDVTLEPVGGSNAPSSPALLRVRPPDSGP